MSKAEHLSAIPIQIAWLDDEGNGYTDVFAVDEFSKAVKGAERLHRVRGPKGGEHQARYRLDISGLRARLDYTADKQFNLRRGMALGVMDLHFSDGSRTSVRKVFWNGELQPETAVQILTKPSAESSAEVVTSSHRVMAEVLLRPGQSKFRSELDRAYAGRCCVSGCKVSWAIDAAHIEPFSSTPSYEISNGLLLRRDLHALFDAHMLGIDPKSLIVTFSAEALSYAEYKKLHLTAKLPRPQPGFENHAPKIERLEARWARFKKQQQD